MHENSYISLRMQDHSRHGHAAAGELFLLSLAQAHVVSTWSSFGYALAHPPYAILCMSHTVLAYAVRLALTHCLRA